MKSYFEIDTTAPTDNFRDPFTRTIISNYYWRILKEQLLKMNIKIPNSYRDVNIDWMWQNWMRRITISATITIGNENGFCLASRKN